MALTHDSYAAQTSSPPGHTSNERLEFLGDAVLGAIVAQSLYAQHPDRAEGKLSPLRASLVSQTALAQTARRLQVGQQLLLGKGEAAAGGAQRPSILAATLEAMIGALFVAEGFEAARRFVQREHLAHVQPAASTDPKTALQEYTQAKFKEAPRYTVTAQSGPAHDRRFSVTVTAAGAAAGSGVGATKKEAEAAAARVALATLRNTRART
ncbi:MAG: ribonuclease III [Candidatus Eremiobacteraeota bacterium]|nr:ribonuclease III [Candidatus Eremiobacteraeota bacterium]